MRSIALAATIFCALWITPAQAHRHSYKHSYKPTPAVCSFFYPCERRVWPMGVHIRATARHTMEYVGSRPRAWCGWFMQRETGITSRGTGLNLNRALEWAHVGHASYPHVNAIVVWRRGRHGGGHVGRIVGGHPGAWVIRSGNDGHRVRDRVRSIANAVAIRAI